MKLFFPHQISITGASASGTSSTMNALKSLLPHNLYRFVSMGALFRLRGSQSGFDTIEDFVKHRLENPEFDIDRQIDEMGNTLGLMDYSVLESRLGYVLWPGAFQVRLVCPLPIRAERRARQLGVSVREAEQLILQRDKDDTCLYQGLYGPGIIWPDNRFNQVIDTSLLTPEQSAKEIVFQHAAWKDGLGQDAFLKSPLCCRLGVNFEELWQQ